MKNTWEYARPRIGGRTAGYSLVTGIDRLFSVLCIRKCLWRADLSPDEEGIAGRKLLEAGNLGEIREYLRKNIHQYGKLKDSRRILRDMTGKILIRHIMWHIWKRSMDGRRKCSKAVDLFFLEFQRGMKIVFKRDFQIGVSPEFR